MKWIDIPPVWLLASLVATWFLAGVWGPSLGAALAWLGYVLVAVGVALAILAVAEMRRSKTTVIPHLTPSHLVTSGIFARTRNPIYLGDVLILSGFILIWNAPLAVVLVPLFVWVIQTRFIQGEEARMRATFGAEFEAYRTQTRRWI